jgi:hypothetical protein
VSSRCALCTARQTDQVRVEGTNGRVIEDNHAVFTSAGHIGDTCADERDGNYHPSLFPVTPSLFLMSFVL